MINAKENCKPNPQKIIFLSTKDLLLESKNEILNNTIIPKIPVYCSISLYAWRVKATSTTSFICISFSNNNLLSLFGDSLGICCVFSALHTYSC